MDDIPSRTQTELEAAAFRRLLSHLRRRTDVQNIDLMILAGFCRNCLSDWFREAADHKGLSLSRDDARRLIYGMEFADWKKQHQTEASPEKMDALRKVPKSHQ